MFENVMHPGRSSEEKKSIFHKILLRGVSAKDANAALGREPDEELSSLGLANAARIGMLDGFENPDDLQHGMTWERDQDGNECYDAGVNIGQAIATFRENVRDVARMAWSRFRA